MTPDEPNAAPAPEQAGPSADADAPAGPPAPQWPEAAPTDLKRHFWLFALIALVVVVAWLVSLVWGTVGRAAATQAPLQAEQPARAIVAPRTAASPPAAASPEPMVAPEGAAGQSAAPFEPVVPLRLMGADGLFLAASPPLRMQADGPVYRLGRLFDVTRQVSGLNLAELVRLAGRWADQMTPLDLDAEGAPPRTPAATAVAPLADPRVVTVTVGGETHGYGVETLSQCAGVFDTVGGRRVFVCWNALAQSPTCLAGDRTGRLLAWRDAGLLYRGSCVYYDAETGSLWDAGEGLALTGRLAGGRVAMLRADVWPWGSWAPAHADALVLTGPPLSADAVGQQTSYLTSPLVPMPATETEGGPALPPKAFVLGIAVEGQARAYPLELLTAQGTTEVRDTVAYRPVDVRVTSDRTAYALPADTEMQASVTLWFAWRAAHPNTDVYQSVPTMPGEGASP